LTEVWTVCYGAPPLQLGRVTGEAMPRGWAHAHINAYSGNMSARWTASLGNAYSGNMSARWTAKLGEQIRTLEYKWTTKSWRKLGVPFVRSLTFTEDVDNVVDGEDGTMFAGCVRNCSPPKEVVLVLVT